MCLSCCFWMFFFLWWWGVSRQIHVQQRWQIPWQWCNLYHIKGMFPIKLYRWIQGLVVDSRCSTSFVKFLFKRYFQLPFQHHNYYDYLFGSHVWFKVMFSRQNFRLQSIGLFWTWNLDCSNQRNDATFTCQMLLAKRCCSKGWTSLVQCWCITYLIFPTKAFDLFLLLGFNWWNFPPLFDTPLKFNIAPGKWWLEGDPFLLGFGNFSGAMLNFGRVDFRIFFILVAPFGMVHVMYINLSHVMQLAKVRTKDSLETIDPLHRLRSMQSFPAEVAFQGFGGSLPQLKEGGGVISTKWMEGEGKCCHPQSWVMELGCPEAAQVLIPAPSCLVGGMLKKLVFLMVACATRQGESQMMQGTEWSGWGSSIFIYRSQRFDVRKDSAIAGCSWNHRHEII